MSTFGSAVRRADGKEDKMENFSEYYFMDDGSTYVSGLKKIGDVNMNILSMGYWPKIIMSFSRRIPVEFQKEEIEFKDIHGNLRKIKIKSAKSQKLIRYTRIYIEVVFNHTTDHVFGKKGGRFWNEKMIMMEAKHIVENMDEIIRLADEKSKASNE